MERNKGERKNGWAELSAVAVCVCVSFLLSTNSTHPPKSPLVFLWVLLGSALSQRGF